MADKILIPRISQEVDKGGSIQRAIDNLVKKVNTATTNVYSGYGSPEGVLAADVGSLYTDKKGVAGAILYVKESGTGVNGWYLVNSSSVPIGAIVAYAGESIPTGYLNCDGRAINRTEYSDLFTAIGTTWGAGDGSTTFNIPDLRSATLRGVGTPTIFTENTAITLAQIIDDKFQEHKHKYSGVYNYAFKAASGTAVGVITSSGQTSAGETTGAGYVTYRVGLETTGKARGVYWIIKYADSVSVNQSITSTTNVYNSLTALAGGGQVNATNLAKGINIITTCATQFDSAKLPILFEIGDVITVKNIGSKQAWIYPNTDHTIESLSANTGVGLLPNNSLTFVAVSSTAWSLISGQMQLSHQQTLTVSGTGLTRRRAVGKIELETLTNTLRLKDYNIAMSRASGSAITSMTFTISGVVFKTIDTINWQAGYGDINGGAVGYAQPIGTTSTIIMSHASTNVLSYSLFGSAELNSQTLL